jgi:hypothetical protein
MFSSRHEISCNRLNSLMKTLHRRTTRALIYIQGQDIFLSNRTLRQERFFPWNPVTYHTALLLQCYDTDLIEQDTCASRNYH